MESSITDIMWMVQREPTKNNRADDVEILSDDLKRQPKDCAYRHVVAKDEICMAEGNDIYAR